MYTSRYIVQKAPGVDGPPIPEDEPVLVIRAQDVLAPLMMKLYRQAYENMPDCNSEVIQRLCHHQLEITIWREANADKVKVAD